MRLKEASNGEGPLEEVEKKLILQEKREQDKKNRQRKYLEKNASVFDIINNKLSSKSNFNYIYLFLIFIQWIPTPAIAGLVRINAKERDKKERKGIEA